jgi:hypothetical protein
MFNELPTSDTGKCWTKFLAYFYTERGHVAMVGRTVYVPPLPRDIADLKAQIIAAVKNIDAPMLTRVW